MKVSILGAGIAGAVAYSFFKNEEATVFDSKPAGDIFSSHKAVMRISDDRIGLLLGGNVKKIKVEKAVLWKGTLQSSASIAAKNKYSIKVAGLISQRSIYNLTTADRLLLKPFSIDRAQFGKEAVEISDKTIFFSDGSKQKYDVCISTVPILSLSRLTHTSVNESLFYSTPIFVVRCILSIDCLVNQTIYLPEDEFNSYRATLQENELIIEAVRDFSSDSEVSMILELFGLDSRHISSTSKHRQELGKLHCSDDNIRRWLILEFSQKFDIFSLGRFATWRNIKVDSLIDDIEAIKRMVSISSTRREYESKIAE